MEPNIMNVCSRLQQAEKSLQRYYKLHGKQYLDNDGNGKFKLWANENGYDSDLIEEEFNNEPDESVLVDIDDNFPPNNLKPEEILAILRKCWTDSNAFVKQKSDVNETQNNTDSQSHHENQSNTDTQHKSKDNYDQNDNIALKFISKDKCNEIIYGFTRIFNIPSSVLQIIFNHYFIKYHICKFSTTFVDPLVRVNSKPIYHLTHNNKKVTSARGGAVYLVSESIAHKTGIHVFRYYLHYPICEESSNGAVMIFAVHIADQYAIRKPKNHGGIAGWHSTSGRVYVPTIDDYRNQYYKKIGHQKIASNQRLKKFPKGKSHLLTFDLKLNCVENTLSFKMVFVGKKRVNRKESMIHILPEFTNKYGWVPYVSIQRSLQSVVICEINPDFYGLCVDEIDEVISEMLMQNT